jgi:hypothetical protein
MVPVAKWRFAFAFNNRISDNTFYYASQTNPDTGCETSRRPVLVTVGVVPVPTGDPIKVSVICRAIRQHSMM